MNKFEVMFVRRLCIKYNSSRLIKCCRVFGGSIETKPFMLSQRRFKLERPVKVNEPSCKYVSLFESSQRNVSDLSEANVYGSISVS